MMAFVRSGENARCADCGANAPRWASLQLGAVICIACAGVHRTLANAINTRVKSFTLDRWSEDEIAHFLTLGNRRVNESYGVVSGAPPNVKDLIADDAKLRHDFILAKYTRTDFAMPTPGSL
uniref:Arf-GAP domain-containing protein n=1 Tax=Arcella intermedia TaxID=1963864 RepID=A0A6B2LSG1_9EUKA